MKYKWQNNFSKGLDIISEKFIKKIFKRLNEGVLYADDKGGFCGYITAINGPLGIIHIISDHSLDTKKSGFVTIIIRYLDHTVFYLRIDNGCLSVFKFDNGWWANKI